MSKNCKCERCHKPVFVTGVSDDSIPKAYRTKYIVHHKEHITADNLSNDNVTYNMDNLELLCESCHNKEHFINNGAVKNGYKFDRYGMLIKDC